MISTARFNIQWKVKASQIYVVMIKEWKFDAATGSVS